MSVSLPNGAIIAIASGYGASKAMSAVSNANPAVATLEAAHGILLGEYMEVTSGWSRLKDKIVRAGTVSTNDVQLAGINSTLTSIYPASAGTGSIREITGWTQLAQILGTASNGGDQNFLEYQFLEDDAQKRIPTFKSAEGLTITVGDDQSLGGMVIALAANEDRLPRAVRVTLPSGAIILYNAYISVNKTPTLTINQLMANTVTLSFLAEPTRYAS